MSQLSIRFAADAVRAAAKRLVPTKAWATKDATADEIARIALLRVLFLQRETRRAARHAEAEAAAMLARGSMEATISGLFCVHVPGAEKLFDGEIAKRAKNLFGDLAAAAEMTGMFDQAFDQIGSGRLPNVTEMVKQIKANGGGSGIGSLHTKFYDQISTFYVHGGPLGLIRHVHPKTEATLQRPFSVWSMLSAVHISDAMVGLLAATIAGKDHPDSGLFREYETAHLGVTWTPLAFVARGLMARVDWRHVPATIRLVRRLMAKTQAAEPFTEADVEEFIVTLNQFTGLDPDDQTYSPFMDVFRAKLLHPGSDDAGSASVPPS